MPIRLCLLVYAAFFCAPLPFVRAQSAVATTPPKMATTPAIVASPESVAEWQYKFSAEDEALLDQIEKGCFQYFWKEVGHPALLARDKTSDMISSTAAVGFQLSSLPIGIERGWITRAEGEERALTILRTLFNREDNKKRRHLLSLCRRRHRRPVGLQEHEVSL